jgi:hypothetical protein
MKIYVLVLFFVIGGLRNGSKIQKNGSFAVFN